MDTEVVSGLVGGDLSRPTLEVLLRVLQLPNAGQVSLGGTSGCSRTPNGSFSTCCRRITF
jgi:hypothetical protein